MLAAEKAFGMSSTINAENDGLPDFIGKRGGKT
jgi:hypothetical protein